MDDELIVLEVSPERDPGGVELRAALHAHLEAERQRFLRGLFVSCLAVLGVPLWLAAAWPRLLPDGLRHFVLLAWAACGVGSVWSAFSEARWRHRLLQHEATLEKANTIQR